MGRKRIWLAASLLVFLFATQLFAQTDSYTRMYGLSSRSAAMGGAMVGIAEGIDALAYNPAALALTRNSVTLQLDTFPSSKLMANNLNSGPSGVGITAGLTQRFLRDRIGLGVLFTQSGGGGGGGGSSLLGGGSGVNWPTYSGPGTFNFTAGGFGVSSLEWALALRLHDTLGIAVMPTTNVWVRTSPIQLGLSQILQGILGTTVGAPSTDVNPNIGLGISGEEAKYAFAVAWRPLKYLSFGYESIPETKIRLRVPITIKGGGLIDDINDVLLSDIETNPPIEQYGVGVNIPISNSKLTLAWTLQDIGYGKLYNDLYSDYLKYNDPLLKNAVKVNYGAPSKVNDAVVNRFGVEYLLGLKGLKGVPAALSRRNAVMAFRGGYFKWNSPYPQNPDNWTLDNNADVYSMGLGLAFDRAGKSSLENPLTTRTFSVNMHVQYIDLADKNYKLQYNYWGSPASSGDLYYFHTEGQILVVGLELSWLH